MKGLSLVALNVRSLYSKLDELYIRFNDYDFLCFSETWANGSHTDEMLSLKGYELYRLDRCSNEQILNLNNSMKRAGGLIIYVKNDLCKYISLFTCGCSISPNLEQLFILYDRPNVYMNYHLRYDHSNPLFKVN